tara:strand:- start:15 stop:671 length:657 start_codon:yes stop_codon:yes gene_type:complete
MAHLLFTALLLCYPSYGNILSRRAFIGNTIGMSLINKATIVNANNDEEPGLIRGLNNNLYYSGPMTDTTIFSITSNLIALQQESNINEINLHMQSSGGSLLPSLALVDLIRVSDIPINTYVDGYCASAASLITVVGAQRFINKHGVILIHQLKMGIEPSKYLEIKDQSVNADTLMNIIKEIYLENTNLSPGKLDELLMHDWWLNSTLSKEYGIIDIII